MNVAEKLSNLLFVVLPVPLALLWAMFASWLGDWDVVAAALAAAAFLRADKAADLAAEAARASRKPRASRKS